jgi:hypothetical protein
MIIVRVEKTGVETRLKAKLVEGRYLNIGYRLMRDVGRMIDNGGEDDGE